MVDEHRVERRYLLPLEVRWESLSGKYAARISDISMGGCYIESLAQVEVGEEIHFEFNLPTGFWMPLRGTVVHHQPNIGFGLRFAPLTLMERNLLTRLLETAGGR